MSSFTTKSVGKNIAEVEDFIISEEPMARLVFRSKIHAGGVRGRLIRQRRQSKDDEWIDDSPIDIRTLEKGDSFNVELRTEAVTKLHRVIGELNSHISSNGVEYGTHDYKTVKADSVVVNSKNIKEIIQKIIDREYSSEVLEAFSKSEKINVDTFIDAERVKSRRAIVNTLDARLLPGVKFAEVSGDDSWQKFILNNHWMFGANYLDPIDRAKININGSMPDFIYPTADGFADILDIKLPTDDVSMRIRAMLARGSGVQIQTQQSVRWQTI